MENDKNKFANGSAHTRDIPLDVVRSGLPGQMTVDLKNDQDDIFEDSKIVFPQRSYILKIIL